MSAAMASTSSAELLGEIRARRGPIDGGGHKSRRQKISEYVILARRLRLLSPTVQRINQSFSRSCKEEEQRVLISFELVDLLEMWASQD